MKAVLKKWLRKRKPQENSKGNTKLSFKSMILYSSTMSKCSKRANFTSTRDQTVRDAMSGLGLEKQWLLVSRVTKLLSFKAVCQGEAREQTMESVAS